MSIGHASDQTPAVVKRIVTFTKRWFVRLNAASGFVSRRPQNLMIGADHYMVTAHESERRSGQVRDWPELVRYARGAFWGNALGAELCERLGGVDRVLREAPAAVAEPLGGGVWLQLSGLPPVEPEELSRLTEYLKPILSWTRRDLDELRDTRPPGEPLPESDAPPPGSPSVPVEVTQLLDPSIALNIHLRETPTKKQQAIVESALDAWFRFGSEGGFGLRFHWMSQPTWMRESTGDGSGAVVRCWADPGSADFTAAIDDLARRLGGLADTKVLRLIVGQEVEPRELLGSTRIDLEQLGETWQPSSRSSPSATPSPPNDAEPVPIDITEILDPNITLNIHLEHTPTDATTTAIEAILDTWCRRGFDGDFGGKGFHALGGISLDRARAVMTCSADLGTANPRKALESLAFQLASILDPKVKRIVVGTEEVG